MELPKSWTIVKVSQVCEILDSKRVPINSTERALRTFGKTKLFPYYGATGEVGKIDDYLFEGEYLLLGEDGAPFLEPFKNKAYLVNGKFWVNNHAHILQTNISNKFICYYFNQLNFANYVTGTTRLKLNQSVLKEIPVLFPPANEQHRIVAKIEALFSELDKGVENLKIAREQLKIYRQALLKHAFSGKLTAQWRAENSDKLETAAVLLQRIQTERQQRYQQQLKDWETNGKQGSKPKIPKTLPPLTAEELAELPELPEGWAWVKLSAISTNIQIGPFGASLHKGDYISNAIPLVNPSHIKNLKIIPDWDSTVNEQKLKELSNYILKTNDIIIGRRGEMGRCAVVRKAESGWLCGTGSLFVRLLPSLNADFYCYILSSKIVKEYLSSSSIGTTMQNLNREILDSVPVPLCSSLEQQAIFEQIERQFSIIDQLDETLTIALQQAETLRQSILKKAFSGQLVAQNPDDEPASELLKRIQAEKAAATKGKKL